MQNHLALHNFTLGNFAIVFPENTLNFSKAMRYLG